MTRRPRAVVAAIGLALAAAGAACASSPEGGTPEPSATPLTWALDASPAAPAGLTDLSLAAVACVSDTGCWAVGAADTAAKSSQTLIEQLTGGAWRVVASPDPPGSTFSALGGVSCAGSGTCWAVGYSTDSDGAASTLIEEDAGDGWAIVASPPQPDGEAGFLNGVTCAGDRCWAAGSVHTADGMSGTLIEEDTGSGWSIVATPLAPAEVTSELDAVSCTEAGGCWASGDLVDSSGAVQVLTEQNAGSGWSVVTSPSAADDAPSSLGALSCVSAGDCWAVGEYDDLTGASHALVEHDGGSGWSIVSTPAAPGGAGELLSGITCVTAQDCWAVGRTLQAQGDSAALIEQYGGGGWTIVASPAGPVSTTTQLAAVACVSPEHCWAVGTGSTSALIEEGR